MTASLRGMRVLVPVTAGRRDFAQLLGDLGAEVTGVEFIQIEPPTDPAALERAARDWVAGAYDWLAVTSRNAVTSLVDHGQRCGVDVAAGPGQVAAVGAATGKACADLGLTIALQPSVRADAVGMVATFPAGAGRVLAPLGNLASDVLTSGLRAKGWDVDEVEAYRTVRGPGMDDQTLADLRGGGYDAVVVTSGSVADALADQIGGQPPARIIAIGRTTAARWRTGGLTVDAIAATPTYDALVACLVPATGEGAHS